VPTACEAQGGRAGTGKFHSVYNVGDLSSIASRHVLSSRSSHQNCCSAEKLTAVLFSLAVCPSPAPCSTPAWPRTRSLLPVPTVAPAVRTACVRGDNPPRRLTLLRSGLQQCCCWVVKPTAGLYLHALDPGSSCCSRLAALCASSVIFLAFGAVSDFGLFALQDRSCFPHRGAEDCQAGPQAEEVLRLKLTKCIRIKPRE